MAKSNAVWGIDIGQCAESAALPAAREGRQAAGRRGLRLHRIPEDSHAARSQSRRADPRGAAAVRLAQRCGGRQRGDRRAGPKRPGAVHQAAAGRAQEDSGHRQVRSPAADSVRAGRRRLGLPAARRQRGRRLRDRDGSRPVRDEARPGGPRTSSRSKRPASTVDIIQLAPLAIYNFVCFDRLEGRRRVRSGQAAASRR